VSGPTDWVSIPYAAQVAGVETAAIFALTQHTEPVWLDGTGPEQPCIDSRPSDNGIRVRLSDVLELAPAMRAIFGEIQRGGALS
jgi:hypothetical protein